MTQNHTSYTVHHPELPFYRPRQSPHSSPHPHPYQHMCSILQFPLLPYPGRTPALFVIIVGSRHCHRSPRCQKKTRFHYNLYNVPTASLLESQVLTVTRIRLHNWGGFFFVCMDVSELPAFYYLSLQAHGLKSCITRFPFLPDHSSVLYNLYRYTSHLD